MIAAGEEWTQGGCHICQCVDGEVQCRKSCNITSCPQGQLITHPSDDQCCYCSNICPTKAPPKPVVPVRGCGLSTSSGYYSKQVGSKNCTTSRQISMTACSGTC